MKKNLLKVNPSEMRFLTPEARITSTCLKNDFTKAQILYYFDLEDCIQIETDTSSLVIGRIFCELTFMYVNHTNLNLSTFKIS